MARNHKQPTSARRTFQFTSIVIVAIFVLVITAGVFRELTLNNARPTSEQATAARDIVSASLASSNDSIGRYALSTARRLHDERGHATLQVYLSSNSSKDVYLVDLEARSILVHARIDFKDLGSYEDACDRLDACHLFGRSG